MNGGYILIDCQGLDLTKGSTPQSISGLYSKMQAAKKTGKPVYADNMVWGVQGAVTPYNVLLVQFEGYIIATASTLQIIVTNADSVTINNMVGE